MMQLELRENGSESDEAVNVEQAIRKVRDEITLYLMTLYRGSNRNLAMVLTKLDEAEHWAVRHGMDTGRLVTVNRSELLKAANDV